MIVKIIQHQASPGLQQVLSGMKINFKNEETATRSVPFELTHTPRTRQSGKRIGPWQTERKKQKKKKRRELHSYKQREGIRSFSFLERKKENEEERGKRDPHKSIACVLHWISLRHFFCL